MPEHVHGLLLDTCALVWIAEGDAIAQAASDALDAAYAADRSVLVCAISAWEIGMLMSRGRLTSLISPQVWFRRVLDTPSTRLADMTTDILIASSFLPGKPPRDPADRIIAATARENGYTLLTRDRLLLEYAEQGHIRALPC
jgi:PIN domain nuclease of toxin-antitoxin system